MVHFCVKENPLIFSREHSLPVFVEMRVFFKIRLQNSSYMYDPLVIVYFFLSFLLPIILFSASSTSIV
jgi:hypothetical protein